ncbi:MAG: OmpA family protein [Chitinivibrionales bacterium]|nr:OmpA family protein [Chitinivibrionales bacterium]
MKRLPSILFLTSAVLLMALYGCGKKTTTIKDTMPEPEPSVTTEVETPEPETEPSDDIVFQTRDIDAEMQEIFVPIYFEYDQYELRGDAIQKLERAARFLSENTDVRILLEGHADERGSNEYNIGLGENRAKTVKSYLTSYGIPSSRLEFTSYGRERPAITNCPDEECHKKNRRVEWKVLER